MNEKSEGEGKDVFSMWWEGRMGRIVKRIATVTGSATKEASKEDEWARSKWKGKEEAEGRGGGTDPCKSYRTTCRR